MPSAAHLPSSLPPLPPRHGGLPRPPRPTAAASPVLSCGGPSPARAPPWPLDARSRRRWFVPPPPRPRTAADPRPSEAFRPQAMAAPLVCASPVRVASAEALHRHRPTALCHGRAARRRRLARARHHERRCAHGGRRHAGLPVDAMAGAVVVSSRGGAIVALEGFLKQLWVF